MLHFAHLDSTEPVISQLGIYPVTPFKKKPLYLPHSQFQFDKMP